MESSENLSSDSAFKSFIKMPKLKGLPVYDNKDTLEKLILGDYPLYDRSKISLQDFLRHKLPSSQWGDAPTREGRASFTEAFTNFQQVLVVYFGYSFDTSLRRYWKCYIMMRTFCKNITIPISKSRWKWLFHSFTKMFIKNEHL